MLFQISALPLTFLEPFDSICVLYFLIFSYTMRKKGKTDQIGGFKRETNSLKSGPNSKLKSPFHYSKC